MSPAHMIQRFDGYRKTHFLWKGSLQGLEMISAGKGASDGYPTIDTSSPLRLGKLTEQFVLYELDQDDSVEILHSNVQIFQKRRTVGELDCLLQQASIKLHLEFVFKFYLYDPSFPNELDRWIGPNRNDSLVRKLTKLKEKQLPLLYHPETKQLLDAMGMQAIDFKQMVHFKAQLFIPLHAPKAQYRFVNPKCIVGFYLQRSELPLFPQHTFYIPAKLDWLMEPHAEVDWMSHGDFQEAVGQQLGSHRSPLCWMQSPTGEMQRFFAVWW